MVPLQAGLYPPCSHASKMKCTSSWVVWCVLCCFNNAHTSFTQNSSCKFLNENPNSLMMIFSTHLAPPTRSPGYPPSLFQLYLGLMTSHEMTASPVLDSSWVKCAAECVGFPANRKKRSARSCYFYLALRLVEIKKHLRAR